MVLKTQFPPDRPTCRRCLAAQKRLWYSKNIEKCRRQKNESDQRHRSTKRQYSSKYHAENAVKISKQRREYYLENREALIRKQSNYVLQRRRSDLVFKLISTLRSRVSNALKKKTKSGSAIKDLGCSPDELRRHLELKFYPNPETGEAMSWDNWGINGWHIDHKKPLSLLTKDPSNRSLFLELNHYTNLQPLWAKENIRKGDSVE